MRTRIPLLLIVPALLLSSCSSGDAESAPAAIERYIQAIVAQDETAAASLSCAAWEEQALTEVHAFDGVTARLEDLSCTEGPTEDATIVNCTGTIIATYQGEDRPLDLAARAYLAVQEGGEWRMCGYK